MRDRAAVLALPLLAGACSYRRYQSTFGEAADEVRQFNSLFLVFLVVCAMMYVLVIAFLIGGIMRPRRSVGRAKVTEDGDPLLRSLLIGWSALIGVGVIGLAVASFFGDRSLARAAARQKLSVTVIANQWWWDIRYNATDNSKVLRTANELHLPVGVPVRIYLRSNDVIHSFWVPNLAGKQDLIPGRLNDITIVPRRIGIYRGQCAEFCGAQHAHMALIVSVDTYPDYIKWRQHQIQPAPTPAAPLAQAGYDYVTSRKCNLCHRIAGTAAAGTAGPDLTHLASRRTIAAGTLPMSEGNLYGWVANPQALKPGNKMPAPGLEPDQLHAVVEYLGTLQ